MSNIQFDSGLTKELNETELKEFYHRMRPVVVNISSLSGGEEFFSVGTYVTSRGDILTSARRLSPNFERIHWIKVKGTQTEGNTSESVHIEHIDSFLDLAILRNRKSSRNYDHVTFAEATEVEVGKTLVMLTNLSCDEVLSQLTDTIPPSLSQEVGMISFPAAPLPRRAHDCRLWEDIAPPLLPPRAQDCRLLKDIAPSVPRLSERYVDPYLALVEMSGLYVSQESFGAPVLNRYGRLVGMYNFQKTFNISRRVHNAFFEACRRSSHPRYQYAIHVCVIQDFMMQYEELRTHHLDQQISMEESSDDDYSMRSDDMEESSDDN